MGMGPICRAREKCQKELFSDNNAVFSVMDVKNTFILIKDAGHNTHKSVTNDVETVLSELASKYNIAHRRIFYIDSLGATDEIIHNGKDFMGFRSGHKGVEL
jgi:predicted peptidase